MFSGWPWLISHDRKAIPHPVLTTFRSVGSVWLTKSGMPLCAQAGAVAKSDKALLLVAAAHHPDKGSPVLTPHRFPPIEHSLSSASNRDARRTRASNDAQRATSA